MKEEVVVVCKEAMLVGVEPHELLGECSIVHPCVVVLLLVEECITVLSEGFKEFHPYYALDLPCTEACS